MSKLNIPVCFATSCAPTVCRLTQSSLAMGEKIPPLDPYDMMLVMGGHRMSGKKQSIPGW